MPFPTNPSDGEFYIENDVTWLYVSPPGVWTKAGGTPISIDESDPVFAASAASSYTEAPVDGTPYSRQDGGWVAAASAVNSINDIGDVDTTGVVGGDVLKWSGSAWLPAADAGVDSLVDLTDTTLTSPANGEVLQYNGAAWVNATAPAGYTDADVDTHLNTGTATTGEVLSWTGSDYDWIAAGGGLSTTATSPVATVTTLENLDVDTGLNSKGVAAGFFVGPNSTENTGFATSYRVGGANTVSLPYYGGVAYYGSAKTILAGRNGAALSVSGADLQVTSSDFGFYTTSTTPKFKVTTGGAATFNNAFTFPTADGTANQVLTTNGSGTVTWQDAGGGGGLSNLATGTDGFHLGGGATVGSTASTATAYGTLSEAGTSSVSIGYDAGSPTGSTTISIGYKAGDQFTSTDSVFVGHTSGAYTGLNQRTTGVGYATTAQNVGTGAVGVGWQALNLNAGQYAVAVGYQAGNSGMPANAVCINATGAAAVPNVAGDILISTTTAQIAYDDALGFGLQNGKDATPFTATINPETGVYVFPNLPTSDPVNAGQLWNDAGTLKVSAG